MHVAVGCREEWLGDRSSAVVVAAGGTPLRCDDADDVAAVWGSAAAVILDVTTAASVATRALPVRESVIIVADPASIAPAWRIAAQIGAAAVIALPDGEALLLEGLLEGFGRDPASGLVVVVAGCGGGAGASTLAVALAAEAHRAGRRPVLIDADPFGGGVDVLLGAEAVPGARWSDLAAGPPATMPDLPAVDGIPILSFGRGPSTVDIRTQAAAIGRLAGRHDVVVVDASRSQAASLVEATTPAAVLLVAGRQVRSAAAARVLVDALAGSKDRVRLVVGALGTADIAAADLQAALAVPLSTRLPRDSTAARCASAGRLHRLPKRSRLARSARRLLTDDVGAGGP